MLTGIVLTHNESTNIRRCLESLKFCQDILVIDDNSTDDTVKIAKSLGVNVVGHPLTNDFSAQRNFALTQVTTPWALFVDADEEITPQLANEILQVLPHTQEDAFAISRIDYLWQTKLNHGDAGQTKLVRLGKANSGTWKGRVHETWVFSGQQADLTGVINHYPHQSLVHYLQHINFYSTIRAQELTDQAKVINLFQVIIWPIAKFFHQYFFKLGILDGVPGLIYAWILSFYTFLSKGKAYLLQTKHLLPSE